MVAAVIIGSSVVGGIATTVGAGKAADAAAAGAGAAADATLQGTMLQIQEIQRQFDYQQQILQPFVANQYAGQSAYMDLLGIGGGAQAGGGQGPGPGGGGNVYDAFQQSDGSFRVGAGGQQLLTGPGGEPGRDFDSELAGIDEQIAAMQAAGPQRAGGGLSGMVGGALSGQKELRELQAQRDQIMADQQSFAQGATARNAPQYPGSGSTTFNRGDRGQFVDPNLDPTRLADINTLPGEVRGNLLAGTSLQDDALYTDVMGRSLAGGAAGTSVYGDTFQASPGYAFQTEEMQRELDRKNSAGGNYGGRAIMEAQRRAQGLAQGDYYNWAQGRSRDVDRLATAESRDASRLDQAGVNYFGRRAGDATRLDAAASQEDRLMAGDQARDDQAYYNYLAQLSSLGGVGGNPAAQAVNSSQAAAVGIGDAYGAQGRGLADIYGGLGTDQANIYGSQYASYNDIFQGSMQNAVSTGLIT